MICRKQRKYYKLEISSTWEVQLDINIWKRVVNAANYHKCSFSWITRYCVFRLARKKNIFFRHAMKIHSNRIKESNKTSKSHHRHIMCLYGDDEKILRLTAMQLGVTVSHLIRLALHWFLPKIENKSTKWEHIFYHGTKISKKTFVTRTNILNMPDNDTIYYGKWAKNEWWNRPKITIPIPYSDA